MDQVTDVNHQEFWKISKLHALPEFVKNAEVSTKDAEQHTQHLHYTMFADPIGRKFPCNDPANTWLSHVYYLHNASQIPVQKRASIENKLEKFARFWHIEGECKEADDEFVKQATAADPTEGDYALSVEHEGQTINRFPIRNAKTVKTAAEYLYENRSCYPYKWRQIASRNILSKAAKYCADLDSDHETYLEKAAGYGTSQAKPVSEGVLSRILLLGERKEARAAKGGLAELAKEILSLDGLLEPAFLEKTAELLDKIDDNFNLRKYYSRGLNTPEESVFSLTEKKAHQIKAGVVQLTTGSIYNIDDLSKVAKDIYSTAMDDDMVDLVCEDSKISTEKLAMILPTLPRDSASVLEKALSSAGIGSISQDEADI